MFRLSLVLSAVHFVLSYGLRFGFLYTAKLDSEFAQACSRFAEKIEFVLTQPGRWVFEFFAWEDGSVGFWALMVLTSVLWGNVAAFLFKRVFAALFRN